MPAVNDMHVNTFLTSYLSEVEIVGNGRDAAKRRRSHVGYIWTRKFCVLRIWFSGFNFVCIRRFLYCKSHWPNFQRRPVYHSGLFFMLLWIKICSVLKLRMRNAERYNDDRIN